MSVSSEYASDASFRAENLSCTGSNRSIVTTLLVTGSISDKELVNTAKTIFKPPMKGKSMQVLLQCTCSGVLFRARKLQ